MLNEVLHVDVEHVRPSQQVTVSLSVCLQRSVENPAAVPVSEQTPANWDTHPEHNG